MDKDKPKWTCNVSELLSWQRLCVCWQMVSVLLLKENGELTAAAA